MDSTVWILVFSKFSSACKSLIEMLEGSEIDGYFTRVCIDNKQIRNIVKSSKKFSINSVPCILKIDGTSGVAEQYDGRKAFELVSSILPPPPPPQPQFEAFPVIEEEQHEEDEHQEGKTSIDYIERGGSAIRSKISASEVLASHGINTHNVTSLENLDNNESRSVVTSSTESKKTGKPVNISEIMKSVESRAN